MRKLIVFAVLVFVLSFLAGCQAAGNIASDLGPATAKVDAAASKFPAQIKAGIAWLWASYTAIKAKGVTLPAMNDLKETITDIEAAYKTGSIDKALDAYAKARALITQIVSVAGVLS